jgi:hypothetical protein
MPTIKVSDLQPVGFELFHDSESYIKELSDEELAIQGGITPWIVASSEPCGMFVAYTIAATIDYFSGS